MAGFRKRAIKRAMTTSFLVPLVALTLSWAQYAGFDLPSHRWLGFVLLSMSAIPTTLYLFTAAANRPWTDLEREWDVLTDWQRAASSGVALVCGLTAGAAAVLLLLSMLEPTASAREEAPRVPPMVTSSH